TASRTTSLPNRTYTEQFGSHEQSPDRGARKNIALNRPTSVAAPYVDAVHQDRPATCDGVANHDRAPSSGTSGTIDAAGAHNRIGVGGLERHGSAERQESGCNEQE